MNTKTVGVAVGLALALSACETRNTTYIDNSRVTTISQTTLVSVIGGSNVSVSAAPVNTYTDASGRPCQIHSFQDATGQGIATVCLNGTNWVLIDRSYDTQTTNAGNAAPAPAAPAASTDEPRNPAGDWNAVTD